MSESPDLWEGLLARSYRPGGLYDHAEWYDVDYAGYIAESPFYRRLIRERLEDGEAFVELGAGTGRLSVTYASEGTRVHAVEPATSMRERLDARVRRHAHMTRVRAHLSVEAARGHDFAGPGDAAIALVAFPFNGALHVHGHDALADVLTHLKARMRPGGTFAVDVTSPSWEVMAAGSRPWGRLDERVHPDSGKNVLTFDRVRYDEDTRLLHTDYRFVLEDAAEGVELSITQFMWTFQEVRQVVANAGFTDEVVYGDVDFSPLLESSPRMLLAARGP